MKIWRLDFELDEYDNFKMKNEMSLEEIQSFDGRSKESTWREQEVCKLEDKDLSNAPGFYSHIPVFDEMTLNSVRDLIKNDVELLPLLFEGLRFYAINITKVLDCINYEKSEYKTFKDGVRIMRFKKYSFKKDTLGNTQIFKVKDEPLKSPFIRDELKIRIEESSLKGFKFKEVWNSEKEV
jgi:hypothetical protein